MSSSRRNKSSRYRYHNFLSNPYNKVNCLENIIFPKIHFLSSFILVLLQLAKKRLQGDPEQANCSYRSEKLNSLFLSVIVLEGVIRKHLLLMSPISHFKYCDLPLLTYKVYQSSLLLKTCNICYYYLQLHLHHRNLLNRRAIICNICRKETIGKYQLKPHEEFSSFHETGT